MTYKWPIFGSFCTCGMFLEASCCKTDRIALMTASRNSSLGISEKFIWAYFVHLTAFLFTLLEISATKLSIIKKHRPAVPKTRVDRWWAAACRVAAPPRESVSMVETMLWRQVSARDCTRCILNQTTWGQNIGMIKEKGEGRESYFFIRFFQEGLWWHMSMASFLGKSVFLRTLNKKQKYSMITINHCRGWSGINQVASAVKNNLTN